MEEANATLYEMMFIITPDLGESKTEAEINTVKSFLTDNGGKVVFEDVWGLRDLAYTIKKHDRGYYVVLNFQVNGQALTELKADLNLNKNILRYLILKMPKGYEPVTAAEYEAQAEQEAAEKEAEEKKEHLKKLQKPEKKAKPAPKAEKSEKDTKKASKKDDSNLEDVDEKLKNIINDPDITL